jgi:integrase
MPKRIPSYCHHRGNGQAFVTLNGERKYLGVYGSEKSHQRYAEEISRWQADQGQAPEEITVGQLTLIYLEYAKGHYQKDGKPTSKVHVIQAALRALNREWRTLAAKDFTPRRFKQVRENLIASGELCRNTINEYMRLIRAAVRWAVGEELLPPENLVALEAVPDLQAGRTSARESNPVEPVAIEDVEAVLPFLSEPLVGAVRFQLATACRPGEALTLKLADIDRTGEVWIYRPKSHKTAHHGKARIILIGPKAQAVIQSHIKTADPEAYVFAVPGTEGRKHYRRDSYKSAITRACQKAFDMPKELRKVKRTSPAELKAEAEAWRKAHCWHPNQLRHTAATAIRKASTVEESKTILGHADIRTTEIYAERDLAKAAEIIKRIG